MKRTGLSMMRSATDARPTALVRELHQMGATRGDEGVLGRDEERVPQDEQEDRSLEEKRHAPLSGARVLGGWSSSNGDRL